MAFVAWRFRFLVGSSVYTRVALSALSLLTFVLRWVLGPCNWVITSFQGLSGRHSYKVLLLLYCKLITTATHRFLIYYFEFVYFWASATQCLRCLGLLFSNYAVTSPALSRFPSVKDFKVLPIELFCRCPDYSESFDLLERIFLDIPYSSLIDYWFGYLLSLNQLTSMSPSIFHIDSPISWKICCSSS